MELMDAIQISRHLLTQKHCLMGQSMKIRTNEAKIQILYLVQSVLQINRRDIYSNRLQLETERRNEELFSKGGVKRRTRLGTACSNRYAQYTPSILTASFASTKAVLLMKSLKSLSAKNIQKSFSKLQTNING